MNDSLIVGKEIAINTFVFSNQAVGLKKGAITKKYTFTKKEFREELVPPYAYDMQESDDMISFKCSFDSLGDPVFKK